MTEEGLSPAYVLRFLGRLRKQDTGRLLPFEDYHEGCFKGRRG